MTRQTATSIISPAVLRTSGALLAAQTALARLIACDAVEPIGHDATAMDLLIRLDQTPDNRMRAVELSRQLRLSPSHVSRSIDKAESEGLVARSADPHDRRASQVELTDRGRAVLTEFAPLLEAVIDRTIGQVLTPAEAETLVTLLGRIEVAADGR